MADKKRPDPIVINWATPNANTSPRIDSGFTNEIVDFPTSAVTPSPTPSIMFEPIPIMDRNEVMRDIINYFNNRPTTTLPMQTAFRKRRPVNLPRINTNLPRYFRKV